MKYKVLRTDKGMEVLKTQLHELEKIATVITAENDDEETLVELIKDVDLVIVSGAQITRRVFAAGKKLKGLLKWGVGTDSLDLEAATEFGIPVVHCPYYGPQSIADFSFAMMISLAKRLPLIDRDMREQGWMYPTGDAYQQVDLPGKTVGLIGYGRIGQIMGKRCLGFDMDVIVYDPYKESEAANFPQVTFVDLETLLRQSDFISIHVVLTPENTGMIGAREFSMMKPNVIITNTARGAVFDEDAFVAALQNGQVAAAGLDVFCDEPRGLDNPFLQLDNVIVAPHFASYTREAYEQLDVNALKKAKAILAGEPLWDVKNREVLQNRPTL
ncbi:MAG: hydroxyacid dehydrogenase [Chloroflexota bacterium]